MNTSTFLGDFLNLLTHHLKATAHAKEPTWDWAGTLGLLQRALDEAADDDTTLRSRLDVFRTRGDLRRLMTQCMEVKVDAAQTHAFSQAWVRRSLSDKLPERRRLLHWVTEHGLVEMAQGILGEMSPEERNDARHGLYWKNTGLVSSLDTGTGWAWLVRNVSPSMLKVWLDAGPPEWADETDDDGRPVLAYSSRADKDALLLRGADPLRRTRPIEERRLAFMALWQESQLRLARGEAPELSAYMSRSLRKWTPEEQKQVLRCVQWEVAKKGWSSVGDMTERRALINQWMGLPAGHQPATFTIDGVEWPGVAAACRETLLMGNMDHTPQASHRWPQRCTPEPWVTWEWLASVARKEVPKYPWFQAHPREAGSLWLPALTAVLAAPSKGMGWHVLTQLGGGRHPRAWMAVEALGALPALVEAGVQACPAPSLHTTTWKTMVGAASMLFERQAGVEAYAVLRSLQVPACNCSPTDEVHLLMGTWSRWLETHRPSEDELATAQRWQGHHVELDAHIERWALHACLPAEPSVKKRSGVRL